MITVHDVLVRARQIISRPEAWTQGALARDKDSKKVRVSSDLAVCFCGYGANERAALELGVRLTIYSMLRDAGEALRDATPGGRFAEFNDYYGSHAEVLTVFDKAIKDSA